jgi:hypothetical protein
VPPSRAPRAVSRHVLAFLALTLAVSSCGGRPAAAFDGKRAQKWVERQVEFGPRVPGSPAHDSCFAFLVASLARFAPKVEADTFYYHSPDLNKDVRLMNVLARFAPKERKRILLGAHWDTRAWADRDPNPARRNLPILGANDGGSGVAVLLELAEILSRRKPGLGVDIAFFDGEDLGTEKNPSGYFRGSNQYLAWRSTETAPLFVVVVDMVGARGAEFWWEGNSQQGASNIVDLVWARARRERVPQFKSGVKHSIYDDHMPFLNAGIPAIDIIDFDYPEWHTLGDNLSIIDPLILEGVGRVLLSLVTDADFLND